MTMSHFFNLYPDNIFFPLAGENRRFFLDLIVSMHSKFFSESAEFIDTSIPIPRIKDFIEETLHEGSWIDGESEENSIKSRTIYVYNDYLKQVGSISVKTVLNTIFTCHPKLPFWWTSSRTFNSTHPVKLVVVYYQSVII